MEQFYIYLVIKQIIQSIDDRYTITFNDMDFNKPLSVGVYIKQAEPSDYRDIRTGNYWNIKSRVQILFQGPNTGNQSLFSLMALASKIKQKISTSCNTRFEVENPVIDFISTEKVQVMFSLTELLGDVDFKGKTAQGIPRYSLNFKIYYQIGGIE